MRRDVVGQHQDRRLAGRTKSRVTVNTKSGLARYILLQEWLTCSMVMSGRRATKAGPQFFMLFW